MVTRIECLNIEKFRRFEHIEIPFSKNVTLVAGQNGTSKSTLLGMLAQPFSFGVVRGKAAGQADMSTYTSNYHGLKLQEYVDITGKPFMYDCDDVFRLSKRFDLGKKYRYSTGLEGADIIPGSRLQGHPLTTMSRVSSNRMRFVTGPGASHQPGEGNYPHPVIYLGLNRLWPLAVTKRCTFPQDALPEDDKSWYVQKYNEILCLDEHGNGAKFMDTTEKRKFITPESNTYDGESCSAGQDNLSQILTAILSFRSLKTKLGDRYRGGMLLVDELDASLHAFAQDKLLETLCDVSDELSLQIIATTHSLRLLEKAYQSALSRRVEVLYLVNEDGVIVKREFATFLEISNHLRVESPVPSTKKPPKVSVLFEDREGMLFFQQICGTKLKQYVRCANTDALGGGHLKNLATMSRSLPELGSLILVPDGDMVSTWSKPPKNLIALPGGKRPETLIYRQLFSLKESDPFWRSITVTYSRQFAVTSKGGTSLGTGDDKDWVKTWYKGQKGHWGRGNCKVFKLWVEAHKAECLIFCKKFLSLLRARYRGEIPANVIDRALASFNGS